MNAWFVKSVGKFLEKKIAFVPQVEKWALNGKSSSLKFFEI
jgi:hypothetical protein